MASTNCMADNMISTLSSSIRTDEEELMAHGAPFASVITPPRNVVPSNVLDLEAKLTDAEALYTRNPRPDLGTDVDTLKSKLDAAKTDFSAIMEPTVAPTSAADMASEYGKLVEKSRLRTIERETVEQKISIVSDKLRELGEKYTTAAKSEKAGIKVQIDALKIEAAGLTDTSKRFIQESYDAAKQQKAGAVHVVDGKNAVDDLLRELDSVPVAEGKKTLEETLGKSKSFRDTVSNMSREEAESLAASISEKLGSDRSQAEKIMGLNYQGAANRIPNEAIGKMLPDSRELVSKARTRSLNQVDYQQMDRILDQLDAYKGISNSFDLGRAKLDEIFGSTMTNDLKIRSLRNNLTDPSIKSVLSKSNADNLEYAYQAANDLGDIKLSGDIRRVYVNEVVAEIKADSKFGNLSKKSQDFVNNLPTKLSIAESDIDSVVDMANKLPTTKFGRFFKDMIWDVTKWAANHKMYVALLPLAVIGYLGMAAWPMTEVYQWTVGGAAFACGKDLICLMTGIGSQVGNWDKAVSMYEMSLPHFVGQIPIIGDFLKNTIPGFGTFDEFGKKDGSGTAAINAQIAKLRVAGLWKDDGSNGGMGRPLTKEELAEFMKDPANMLKVVSQENVVNYLNADCSSGVCIGIDGAYAGQDLTKLYYAAKKDPGMWNKLPQNLKDKFAEYDALAKKGRQSEIPGWATYSPILTSPATAGPGAGTATALSPWLTGKSGSERMAAYLNPMDTSPLYQEEKQEIYNYIHPGGELDLDKAQEIFPGLSSLQLEKMFPGELVGAIQRQIKAKYGSNPEDAYKAAAAMESNNQLPYGTTAGEVLPDDLKVGYQTFNNNPANFKYTAQGDQLYWTDLAGKQHFEVFDKNGKIFNPATGLYDKNLKKTEADGSEFTVDAGKLAAFYNSGSKDIDAFLADPNNYIQTWKGTGAKTGGSSGGGKSSGKSGGSSYSKSTGQTGIFIDAAGLNAEVWEGTAKIGDTDVTIDVEAGVHTIVIKKAGYKSYTVPVQVYAGSIARKSVTLYVDSTTQTTVQKFLAAIGGENVLSPDHIVYAYAVVNNDSALAASAKAEASPTFTGTWSFTANDVLSLIATYGGV
jgi:hypothetical protein